VTRLDRAFERIRSPLSVVSAKWMHFFGKKRADIPDRVFDWV